MMRFEAQCAEYQKAIEEALAAAMDACESPEPLLDAMRYSLLAGGKRLRPLLLLASCEAAGGDAMAAMPFAIALEMIHTYSLIHDDLPAMDNDDLRRGRPTNHKVYGEGLAILAGDGLLSLAFELMLDATNTPAQIEAARRIARAAGVRGMVGGQCVDVTCEAQKTGGEEELAYIHRHKTADLFIGATAAGLLLGGADAETVEAGARFGESLGIAFQIRDDLLDVEGDAALLGKETGMDAARGKLTWPGVYGVAASKLAVRERTDAALDALDILGSRASFLRSLALRLLERDQ